MSIRRILALGLCVAACQQTPTYLGESLLCDPGCPDVGMRCIDGRCVFNSTPSLSTLGVLEAVVGNEVRVEVEAFDDDGDALTFTWTQVDGPSLLTSPVDGAVLAVTPTARASYVFEVAVEDGFGTSREQLTIVATNSVPEIAPFDLVEEPIGTEVTATAVVTDADAGQTVSVTWEQTGGPDLGLGIVNALSLVFTPTQLGTHVFTATPDDGAELGEPQQLVVLVQPNAALVYVDAASKVDPNAETCGSALAPCPSIGDGLAAARAATPPIELLFVAANTTGTSYAECVDLTGSEELRGGFEPSTWRELPELYRTETRVTCDDPLGHRVSGDALLANIRLLSADQPADPGPVVTLFVTGSPTIVDVDVEAAACGANCNAFGVYVSGGAAVLTGLDVRARDTGFNVLDFYTGIVLEESNATVEASNGPDGARGSVTMDVPVNINATGIYVARGAPLIDGITVTGGLGTRIDGILVLGADATVSNCDVQLTAFGSNVIDGIAALECAPQEGCLCDATRFPCDATTQSILIATNNMVRVESTADAFLQVPCEGIGIGALGESRGHIVTGNTVDILKAFSLPGGIAVVGPGPEVVDPATDRIASNVIYVEDGIYDFSCDVFRGSGIVENFSGGLGLAAAGIGTIVELNDVTVGSHDLLTVGFLGGDISGGAVRENTITVGVSTSGAVTPVASGALLQGGDPNDPAFFERNRVVMGQDAGRGAALTFAGPQPWVVANNFLSGGAAVHAAGIAASFATGGDPQWPKIVNNTIVAGDAGALSARGVQVVSGPVASGYFVNNLIDGGEPSGRRYLFHFTGPPPGFATMENNLGQFIGASGAVGPKDLAPPSQTGDMVDGRPFPFWVVGEHAAELIAITADPGPVELASTTIPGRPVSSWAGDTHFGSGVVVGTPQAVTISLNGLGRAGEFSVYSTLTEDQQTHTPQLIVSGDATSDTADDIVFVEDGSVWVMQALEVLIFPAGLSPPVRIREPPITDATHLLRTTRSFGGIAKVIVIEERPAPNADIVGTVFPDGLQVSLAAVLPNGVNTDIQFAVVENMAEEMFGEFLGVDDLLIVADDELTMFDNPGDLLDPSSWTTLPFDFPPCTAGGTMTAQPVSRAEGGSSVEYVSPVMVVSCIDGTDTVVETYVFGNIFDRVWYYDGRTSLGDVTQWQWRSVSGLGGGDFLAVTRSATDSVEVYAYNPPSNSFVSAGSVSFAADIAVAVGEAHFADFSGLAGIAIATNPCPLVSRSSGAADDFHLEAPGGDCADSGSTTLSSLVTRDIDDATRSDPPDVGADEL